MQSLTNPEDLLLNVNSAIVNPYDGFAHGAQGIRLYHRKMKKKSFLIKEHVMISKNVIILKMRQYII